MEGRFIVTLGIQDREDFTVNEDGTPDLEELKKVYQEDVFADIGYDMTIEVISVEVV